MHETATDYDDRRYLLLWNRLDSESGTGNEESKLWFDPGL
ncbi:metal dependent phosphohydrolase [Alicyclobacillus hesperidum URH17-3-68]|nr:metal dependent phosphohydrolase [Alicyclobacillus hesperidum URH17-3-68]